MTTKYLFLGLCQFIVIATPTNNLEFKSKCGRKVGGFGFSRTHAAKVSTWPGVAFYPTIVVIYG